MRFLPAHRLVLVSFLMLLPCSVLAAQDYQLLGSPITGESQHDAAYVVAQSGDGSTIAVGGPRNDDAAGTAGHVRVYRWNGSSYTQLGSDLDGTLEDDEFGSSVALSTLGNTVAIGATQADYFAEDDMEGYVKVFHWDGTSWSQRGPTLNGEDAEDAFGTNVALSGGGTVLAVGAIGNKGPGVPDDDYGEISVYEWAGTTWDQRGNDIPGVADGDEEGQSIALSADGNTLVTGAPENDDAGPNRGHVRVFSWNGTAWNLERPIIQGTRDFDEVGRSVDISSDGSIIAFSADRDPDSSFDLEDQRARIYEWNGTNWTQIGNDIETEQFGGNGLRISLSRSGHSIAMGSPRNSGTGDSADNFQGGQVRVHAWDGSTWSQVGTDIEGDTREQHLGARVSLSHDAARIAVGIDEAGNGRVHVYELVDQPPVFTSAGPFNVEENAAVGTLVGDVDGNNGDGGPTDTGVTYSIDFGSGNTSPDGDADMAFFIDADDGEIRVNDTGDLDFEGTAQFQFTVRIDDGTSETTTTVTIHLDNVNDPPSLSGLPGSVTMLEDEETALDLSSATVSDPDAGMNDISLAISASNGTFTSQDAHGVSVGGYGTASLMLTGSVSELNTFLEESVVYTPPLHAHGTDVSSLTFVLNDDGHSGPGPGMDIQGGTLDVNATSVNDPPSFAVAAEGPPPPPPPGQLAVSYPGWAVSIRPGPQYEDSQNVTFQVTNDNPALFVVEPAVSTSGDLTYTFAQNASGSANVTVLLVDDGGRANGGFDTSTPFSFPIVAPQGSTNSPPAVTDDVATTDEDRQVSVDVLANDSDPDGDPLSVTIVSGPNNGQAFVGNGGVIFYSPNPDYHGADILTYEASDSNGGTATGQLSITVTSVNDRPDAQPDAATTDEDTPVIIDVLANDTDVESDLEIVSTTTPAHGETGLFGPSSSNISYTPEFGYFGTDTFDYVVSDGITTATATVEITILSTNQAPVAVADMATVFDGESIEIDVLANDSDPDSDAIHIQSITGPSVGTAQATGGGIITYVAEPGDDGSRSFDYVIADPESVTAMATVTVDVVGPGPDGDQVRDAVEDGAPNNGDGNGDGIPDRDQVNVSSFPVESGPNAGMYVSLSVPSGQSLTKVESIPNPSPGNFPLGAQAPLGFLSYGVSGVTPGATTVVILDIPTGTSVSSYWKYGPTPDDPSPHWYNFSYDGTTGAIVKPDRLELHFQDGARGDDDLTVNGEILDPGTPVFLSTNERPVAEDDNFTVMEDDSVTVDILANDSDGDGDTLTVIVDTGPEFGSLTETGTKFRYVPDPDFWGLDSFTYTILDPNGAADDADVILQVMAVQDAPDALPDSASTEENASVELDVFANDADRDGDAFWLASMGQPANGKATYLQEGMVRYTPDPHFHGTDSWEYVITDGTHASGAFSTGHIVVTVTSVASAPIARTDSISTREDQPVTFNLLANDTDPDGNALTISTMGNPEHGAVEALSGDEWHYTPDPDFHGTDEWTYAISNGTGSDSARVIVEVLPVNDPPSFGAEPPVDISATTPVLLSAGLNMFSLRAVQAADAENEQITYYWEAAAHPDFSSPMIVISGEARADMVHVDTSMTAMMDAVDGLGLVPGSSIQIHHRLVATDASGARTPGPTQLLMLTLSTATAADERPEVPTEVYLSQNYPNPFNPTTTIQFGLPEPGLVTIELFDVSGRLVRRVLHERLPAGHHDVRLDVTGESSGVYIYRLRTGSIQRSMTLQLIR